MKPQPGMPRMPDMGAVTDTEDTQPVPESETDIPLPVRIAPGEQGSDSRYNGTENVSRSTDPISLETSTSPVRDESYKSPEAEKNLGVDESPEAVAERNRVVEGSLSPENKGFFSNLGEKAKKLAGWAWESMNKVPGVNKIIGKVQIAYHSFWMGRHEEKNKGYAETVSKTEDELHAIEKSFSEITKALEALKTESGSNLTSVEEKLAKIGADRDSLKIKRDYFDAKLYEGNEKMKGYMDSRDKVVDRLAGQYDEKLKPLEGQMEELTTAEDELDMFEAVAEFKNKKSTDRLNSIEMKKGDLEKALMKSGMSEKEVAKFEAIVILNKDIKEGRENLKKEQLDMTKKKALIVAKIAQTQTKIKGIKDKRGKITSIKDNKVSPVEVPEPTVEGEVIGSNTEVGGEAITASAEGTEGEAGIENELASESTEKEPEFKLKDFINSYNEFVKKEFPKDHDPKEIVNGLEFASKNKIKLEQEMDFKSFQKILGKYYKFIKLPKPALKAFKERSDKFYEEKVKPAVKA